MPAEQGPSPANPEALPFPLPPWLRALCRYVPALDSLRTYTFGAFAADLLAGLTVATVAVPQAMAYAILAGLPPQYGLYTAVIMTGVGALFDSSRQLINGPTNAISIALLSALALVPESERVAFAVGFAFLVGQIQLAITVFRLGDLTRYVSHAVVVGFTLGAGVLLVLDQFKNLVGLASRGGPEDYFLTRFWLTLTTGGPWNVPTLGIGVGTMILVVALRRLNGRLRRRRFRFPIPQHLVTVALMALLVWVFHLEQSGVRVVGLVPAALPHFQPPTMDWSRAREMMGNAFGVAILGLLEALAMAKAIASQTGQKLDLNQQCLSEALANLAGSFFQCMPGSGSLTRSAVNQQAGAVSQWSGVFSALAVAGTLLAFAPLAAHIPTAALAGLLMLAAFRMVDYRQLLFHLRATRFDAGIVLATALAAVLISVEFCILIGVFLSFALYIPRAARVRLSRLTWDARGQVREGGLAEPGCGRMVWYDLEGELFFGAAPEVENHLATIERTLPAEGRVVVLYLKRAHNPDAAFLSLLIDFHRRLSKRKVALILAGVREDLAAGLRSTGLDAVIGRHQIVPLAVPDTSTREALTRAYDLLGTDHCPACPREQPAPDGENQSAT